MKKFIHLGLTGGIAWGKTQALKIFQQLGCHIQNADEIVQQIYQENQQIQNKIINRWGKESFENGQINRTFMSKIIFKDSKELHWLQSIIHPLVRAKIFNSIKKDRINVSEIPLLFENHWQNLFDYTIAIWTNKEKQIKRIKKRKWNYERLKKREVFQLDKDDKLNQADFGIINNFSLQILKQQCIRLILSVKGKKNYENR